MCRRDPFPTTLPFGLAGQATKRSRCLYAWIIRSRCGVARGLRWQAKTPWQ